MEQTRLYVGNLGYDVREDELREEFSKYGEVIDVYLPMDRYSSNRSRGFAFVNFKSKDDADAAIDALNNRECFGRKRKCNSLVEFYLSLNTIVVEVNVARPRPTFSSSSRSRRDSYSRRRRSRSPRYRDRRRSYGRSRSPRRDRYY